MPAWETCLGLAWVAIASRQTSRGNADQYVKGFTSVRPFASCGFGPAPFGVFYFLQGSFNLSITS
jgi:hypothetical protein